MAEVFAEIQSVRIDHLHSYFEFEGGEYAFYEFHEGRPTLQWRVRRLAIAFDPGTLRFYRIGIPEELMRWAAAERREIVSPDSSRPDVALCPTGLDVIEFNRLLADAEYITTFLRKAGLI